MQRQRVRDVAGGQVIDSAVWEPQGSALPTVRVVLLWVSRAGGVSRVGGVAHDGRNDRGDKRQRGKPRRIVPNQRADEYYSSSDDEHPVESVQHRHPSPEREHPFSMRPGRS